MSLPKKSPKNLVLFIDTERFKELKCLVRHCAKQDIETTLFSITECKDEDDFFDQLETLLKTSSGDLNISRCAKSLAKNPSNPCKQYGHGDL